MGLNGAPWFLFYCFTRSSFVHFEVYRCAREKWAQETRVKTWRSKCGIGRKNCALGGVGGMPRTRFRGCLSLFVPRFRVCERRCERVRLRQIRARPLRRFTVPRCGQHRKQTNFNNSNAPDYCLPWPSEDHPWPSAPPPPAALSAPSAAASQSSTPSLPCQGQHA